MHLFDRYFELSDLKVQRVRYGLHTVRVVATLRVRRVRRVAVQYLSQYSKYRLRWYVSLSVQL